MSVDESHAPPQSYEPDGVRPLEGEITTGQLASRMEQLFRALEQRLDNLDDPEKGIKKQLEALLKSGDAQSSRMEQQLEGLRQRFDSYEDSQWRTQTLVDALTSSGSIARNMAPLRSGTGLRPVAASSKGVQNLFQDRSTLGRDGTNRGS